MSTLTSLGTGLLLGAALGVIIPEYVCEVCSATHRSQLNIDFGLSRGIEALARSRPSHALDGASIALPLLLGFAFMLIVEQLSSSHSHQRHHTPRAARSHAALDPREEIFDVELAGLEDDEDEDRAAPGPPPPRRASTSVARNNEDDDVPPSAYPITIGLIVHGLADGLALGMSMLSNDNSSSSYGLSLVVFMALAIHKGGSYYQEVVTFLITHSLNRLQLLPPLHTLCL